MKAIQNLAFVLLLSGVFGSMQITAAGDEPAKAILILDASGSMWGQIDGVAKIEIARDAVTKILDGLEGNLHLGLMAYGHRKRGDCDDIELLIPVGPLDKAAFTKTVNSITPRGRTPLTASLRQAAEILRHEEEKATVILVSDGIETCDMDPCSAVEELEKAGMDFTAHVIGFDLADDEQAAIRCIADTTGGEFMAAADASALSTALAAVISKTADVEVPVPAPTPEPTPTPEAVTTIESSKVTLRTLLAEGSDEVKSYFHIYKPGEKSETARGSGPAFELAPGDYLVKAKSSDATLEQTVTVPHEPETTLTLIYNAGRLSLKTLAEEGGEEIKAYYTVSRAGADLSGKRPRIAAGADGSFQLAAGEYHVHAKWGEVVVEDFFEVTPGELTEGVLIAGAGMLKVSAVIGENGEEAKAYFTVNSGKAKLDGSRTRVTAGALGEFRLPAGKYQVEAKWGDVIATKDVEVQAGETTETQIVLEGGLLRVTAQDAEGNTVKPYLYIYAAKTSLGGERKRVAAGSSSDHQVPSGDYVVEAKINDAVVTAPATVKTGEVTEVVLKP